MEAVLTMMVCRGYVTWRPGNTLTKILLQNGQMWFRSYNYMF